jgi:hypothetical protein
MGLIFPHFEHNAGVHPKKRYLIKTRTLWMRKSQAREIEYLHTYFLEK